VKSPIRTEDTSDHGLAIKEIYGFSIFGYSRVPFPTVYEPMFLFLEEIMQTLKCAAHAGGLSVKNLDSIPSIGSPAQGDPYTVNRVGLSGGTFYDLDGEFYCDGDSVFFPLVRTPLLGANATDFSELVEYDALAVMIGASPDTDAKMSALYTTPFPGHENWLQELTHVYDVVILTAGDADFVQAWARDPGKFALLENAIAVVEKAIMASEWYQQHEPELVWDGEFGMCYRLPNEAQADNRSISPEGSPPPLS
jgi:hypothetical protein